MIALDKITHTIAGAAIAAALMPWGVIPAMLAVIVAAVGKEVWDAQGHGTPDRIDALVTVIGTTGITSITATGHSGAVITLVFAAALTVTDGSNLKLASSFTATADDTLTLACDGTNWYEVARSVN